jgi:excisionase family DNA binding protein
VSDLLKVTEAADVLGIGRTLLYDLIAKGEVQSLKIGGARRIARYDLDSYVLKQMNRNRKALDDRQSGRPIHT